MSTSPDPKLQEPATKEQKPKRTGWRWPRGVPKPAKGKVQATLASGLVLGQKLTISFVVPTLAADALTPEEIAALSDALADEVAQHERLLYLFAQLGKASPHAKLISVCLMIGYSRLARRGVVPPMGGAPSDAPSTVSVATGGAPMPDRGYGIGEEHASGIDPTVAHLFTGVEEQAGQGEVPGGAHPKGRATQRRAPQPAGVGA